MAQINFNFKKISMASIPFIVLGIAWFCAFNYDSVPQRLKDAYAILPYMLFMTCLAASIWFQHSRVLFNVLFLMLAMIILTVPIEGLKNLSNKFTVFYNAVCILIPFNILIFAFLKERGILNYWGMTRLLFLLFQVTVVVWDSSRKNPFLERLAVVDINWISPFESVKIPRLAVVLFVLGICVLLFRYMLKFYSLDIAFIGILLSYLVIINFAKVSGLIYIFFSAIFLTLTLSLFEASYSLVFIDSLTGVLSRRALEHEFLKLRKKYTVAMMDIDYFKKFNDTYGHAVGDDVLRMVASITKNVCREGKVFRYGGEEFTIIFAKKNIEQVLDCLENLRSSIENRPLIIRTKGRPRKKPKNPSFKRRKSFKKVYITVSIGAAERTEKNKAPQSVIKQADRALYKAKQGGRNCIVLYKG